MSTYCNPWWLDVYRDSGYECKVCHTKLKTVTPSALKHHGITNKHQKNLQKYYNRNSLDSIQSSSNSQINSQNLGLVQHADTNFQQHKTSKNVHGVNQTVHTVEKSNQNESQKRSWDSDHNVNNVINEKKRRMKYQLQATKDLYDFYLSSKITKIPTESEYIKGIFFTILDQKVLPVFCKMLLDDVGKKPFSLFLEDVPKFEDSSRIAIVIRYYSDTFKKFICLFLNIIRIDARDLQNKHMNIQRKMAYAIEKTAKDFELQLKNLIGIGIHTSSIKQMYHNIEVFEYLKREYKMMGLYPILCTSNSIQKAFLNAFSDSFAGREEYFIKSTYDWFDNKKHTDKIWYDLLNVKKIQHYKRQFDDVSWFFVPEALSNILKNWNGLYDHFKQIKKQSPTAKSLYHIYNSKYYKACLSLIDKPILRDAIRANKEFESLEPDAVKMLSTFIELKNNILKSINEYEKNDLQRFHLENDTQIIPGLKKTIVETYKDFLAKFYKNLSLLNITSKNPTYHNDLYEEIETNMKKLRIGSDHEESIIALSESDKIKSEIILEWDKLQSCLSMIPDTNKLQESWEIIFNQKDSSGDRVYREMSFLAMKHLSLPFSDFNVRRIFYQLNFKDIKKINHHKLSNMNNILKIQNYLKYINECREKDSEVFLGELIKYAACIGNAQSRNQVLCKEDDQILSSMKKRLNIIPL